VDAREAARRTLGAGSARVWQRAFVDPRPAHPIIGIFLMNVEGVADLTRRRAHVQMLHTPETDALVHWAGSKWPWLDEDDADGDGDEEPPEWIVIDDRRYIRHGEGWMLTEHPSQLNNPLWILDALAGAGRAQRAGAEDVRDVPCERYALEPVDLRAAVRATNGRLELPPHGSLEHPTLRGDVWVDADGLIRRVMWSQPHRGRPRLRKDSPAQKLWHCLELWDFGLPVTIEPPPVQPRPPDEPLSVRDVWETGASLWRKRAAYRRAHSRH
jgi:hypothetical protein